MQRFSLTKLAATALILAVSATAQAQDNVDSLGYTVTVSEVLTLNATAGNDGGAITFDGASNDPTFDAGIWAVESNNLLGATVTWEASAFSDGDTASRNVRLSATEVADSDTGDVWIDPAGLTSTSTAVTPAQVQAVSTGAGPASFSVTVTFVTTGDVTPLPAGDYTTTVTGTVTNNGL